MPLEQGILPAAAQTEIVNIVVQLPELVTLRLFVRYPVLLEQLSTRYLPRLRCLDAPLFDFYPFYAFYQRNSHIEEMQVPHDVYWPDTPTTTLPSHRFLTCQVPILTGGLRPLRHEYPVDISTPTPSLNCVARAEFRALTHLRLTRTTDRTFEDVVHVLGQQLVSLRVVEPTLAEFLLSGAAFPFSLVFLRAPRLRYLEHGFFKPRTTTAGPHFWLWGPTACPEFQLRLRDQAWYPARRADETVTLAWHHGDAALTEQATLDGRGRRLVKERRLRPSGIELFLKAGVDIGGRWVRMRKKIDRARKGSSRRGLHALAQERNSAWSTIKSAHKTAAESVSIV
ncbi:uncharacterized protein BXZ73DRAFT_76344 [Epithele typhae]|uniref:uncharacterized protein n=1 Tax=Epithele typhae TaxID=378194 RepID=UPI0020079356|nr:uncharacterized protein BXZ73DRAFT_76344 [Epithele typhae]KAH9938841.1 hypothetical protein BXZ73DRAFT_76344 [Epithele typhae]